MKSVVTIHICTYMYFYFALFYYMGFNQSNVINILLLLFYLSFYSLQMLLGFGGIC